MIVYRESGEGGGRGENTWGDDLRGGSRGSEGPGVGGSDGAEADPDRAAPVLSHPSPLTASAGAGH